MIIEVEGKKVHLEPKTEDFIRKLTESTGTPANEIVSAIVNGQMGRFYG